MIKWKNEAEYLRGLGKGGHSIADVARLYGVSRQRAKQVVDKYVPEWKHVYGKAMRKQDADLRAVQKRKYRQFKKANLILTGSFNDVVWVTHCPVFDVPLDYFSEIKQDCSMSLLAKNGSIHVVSYKAASVLRTTSVHELTELLFFAENT